MSVLLDEETVVLEGLDFTVPCAAGGHSAEVWVQCRTCRKNAAALCIEHLKVKREEVARKLLTSPAVGCARCDAVGMSFDELFEAVPL